MSNKFFNQALADFTMDFASGDAIRSLADKGYSVEEIYKRLDFPTPKEKIRDMVWKHYIECGVIKLEDPKNSTNKRVTYEKVQNNLGRTSFKLFVIEVDELKEYVTIDFGKRLYKDKEAFLKELDKLNPEDRQYILDIPWPISAVWHEKNERIERILSQIGE